MRHQGHENYRKCYVVTESDKAQNTLTGVKNRANLIWPQNMSCLVQKHCNWQIYREQKVCCSRHRKMQRSFDWGEERWHFRRQIHKEKAQQTNRDKKMKRKGKTCEAEKYPREQLTGRWRTTEPHTQNWINVKSSLSIYHIPSVFFKELVERDRGLRMILMVWLVRPQPHTLHPQTRTHKPPHTHTLLWATWSPLTSPPLWSDHSPHWSEVIQRELPSFSDESVLWSGPPSCLRPNLSSVRSKPPFKIIPHCCCSSSSDRRWLFSLLSLPPSPSLTCTYLARQISVWSPSFLIQPCSHSVTPSHSASHFQVQVCFFFFPDWWK